MEDFLGKEIKLGQTVAYSIYNDSMLYAGIIKKITKVKVWIERQYPVGFLRSKYPSDVLIIRE